jgi:hypothetical protein
MTDVILTTCIRSIGPVPVYSLATSYFNIKVLKFKTTFHSCMTADSHFCNSVRPDYPE